MTEVQHEQMFEATWNILLLPYRRPQPSVYIGSVSLWVKYSQVL